ncbi:methyltransferase domain-containing protein [Actinomycetospora rhizophila]|uniref:Methyltransferase domain-containing protein n=1 Tax=Actinomycetospora rhizophila TaxID=1416876 RepID=A0ABV9ZN70_9PSEU
MFSSSLEQGGIVYTLRRALRQYGVAHTGRKILSVARDPWFDLRHGTDTYAQVDVLELEVVGPNQAHAVHYEPTSYHELRQLFRLVEVPREGTFVDLGCGKGLAMLIASDAGFRRVVGVEFSKTLVDVARANIAKYRGGRSDRITVVHADVAEYELDDDETVFFLFNPFREEVMKGFVRNLEQSLQRSDRQVWVIYVRPGQRHVLDASDVFVSTDEYRLTRLQVVVYSNR